jgi:hypothetical protein
MKSVREEQGVGKGHHRRHSLRSGRALAGIHLRAGQAPHRRPALGRPRAQPPKRCSIARKEARLSRATSASPSSSKCASEHRGRTSSPRTLFHLRTRARPWPTLIDLARYLKRNGSRPRQVQDFIPRPCRWPRACTTPGSILHAQKSRCTAKGRQRGEAAAKALMFLLGRRPTTTRCAKRALSRRGRLRSHRHEARLSGPARPARRALPPPP